MKASIVRIYREKTNAPFIPGTRDVRPYACVEVVRYEPIQNANNPTIYVTSETFGFMQHGDAVEWRGIEFQSEQYAKIYSVYTSDYGAVKDAQKRFEQLTAYLDKVIEDYMPDEQP